MLTGCLVIQIKHHHYPVTPIKLIILLVVYKLPVVSDELVTMFSNSIPVFISLCLQVGVRPCDGRNTSAHRVTVQLSLIVTDGVV